MVTMTVYVDTNVFCWIVYSLNRGITCKREDIKEVSLKKTLKFPYEVQVPIQTIGQFIRRNRTTVDLFKLQQFNADRGETV
ncbi:hypothetical protein ABWK22_02850 [Gottfriedia acidiceleris]|uniref:hypothetical protein n=1 Tax=Gottfriedia acidiceleris TaxID=371036 RepID=UPI0033979E00